MAGAFLVGLFFPRPTDRFNTPAYVGAVHDTGTGRDAHHHNVNPDDWIDIWLPSRKEALKWGRKWRRVTIYDKCSRNETIRLNF